MSEFKRPLKLIFQRWGLLWEFLKKKKKAVPKVAYFCLNAKYAKSSTTCRILLSSRDRGTNYSNPEFFISRHKDFFCYSRTARQDNLRDVMVPIFHAFQNSNLCKIIFNSEAISAMCSEASHATWFNYLFIESPK